MAEYRSVGLPTGRCTIGGIWRKYVLCLLRGNDSGIPAVLEAVSATLS